MGDRRDVGRDALLQMRLPKVRWPKGFLLAAAGGSHRPPARQNVHEWEGNCSSSRLRPAPLPHQLTIACAINPLPSFLLLSAELLRAARSTDHLAGRQVMGKL